MPLRQLLAYGLLGLPLAFAALPLYVHLPPLYAGLGVDLAVLGLILMLARLADAGIDPWLGQLADRLSRARMLLLALPLFAAGFLALMHPPADAGAGWLLAFLCPTYLGFSAATLAHQAWGADLGRDARARTRLTAAREGWGLVGVLLAAALPGVLPGGVQGLGSLLPWLVLAAALPLFLALPAAPAPRIAADGAHGWRGLLAEPALRRLLAVFALNGIASALPATLFLFFVADVLQQPEVGGPLLALYFLAGIVSLPLWVRLAARYGRGAAWGGGMLLAMLAFAGTGGLVRGDLLPFALICAASGLALGADLALPAALLADLGERLGQAGRCFGLWNFVAKLNLALAAGLALPLLALAGYAPGGERGQDALQFAYAVLPLSFKALALYLLWRWRAVLEVTR